MPANLLELYQNAASTPKYYYHLTNDKNSSMQGIVCPIYITRPRFYYLVKTEKGGEQISQMHQSTSTYLTQHLHLQLDAVN